MEYGIYEVHSAFAKMVQQIEAHNNVLLPLFFLSPLNEECFIARFGFRLNSEDTLVDSLGPKVNSYLYLNESREIDFNNPYGLLNALLRNNDFLIDFFKSGDVETDIVKLMITSAKDKGTRYSNESMRTIKFTLFLKNKSNYDRIYAGNSAYLYRFDSDDVESVDFSIAVPAHVKKHEVTEVERLNNYLTISNKLLTKVLKGIQFNDYTYINSLVEKFRALKFNWHDVRGDNYEKDTCNYILEHLELY